jgi:hypothetical protein
MKRYEKFQFAWVIVIVFLIIIGLITLAYIYNWGNNPIDTTGYILCLILSVGFFLGFYGMTIIVFDYQIQVKFGIGFYTKRIDFSSIDSISVTKYPLYFGYGIRMIPKGMLYNVSGRHAIEIKIKGKKSALYIGTNDWDNLKMVLEESIKMDKNFNSKL